MEVSVTTITISAHVCLQQFYIDMKRSKSGKESGERSCEATKVKRKRKESDSEESSDIKPRPSGGRSYTVSLALPGSIIENAQSAELRTYLAGQVARAAAVFNVDEVIVFNEQGRMRRQHLTHPQQQQQGGGGSDANTFLARILQYMETPQYLRKALFPMHFDLKLVGLLNPLDCPHHMRQTESSAYREGVVLDRPLKQKSKSGSYVDCGLLKSVRIDKRLMPGVRVTVRLDDTLSSSKHLHGSVVSPAEPREKGGTYWGYNVRLANSLGEVFTSSAFKGGYDLVIGTSERGENIDTITCLPRFKHLLVLFGGVQGLEYSLECDENLKAESVADLCDLYLNLCPEQGSRTIRTEEAILIGLAALRPLITTAGST